MNAKVTIISIRKNTDPTIAKLESVFVKRLKGKCAIQFTDIRPAYQADVNPSLILESEAEKINSHLQGSSLHKIALDSGGQSISSEAFAKLLEKYLSAKGPDIRFIIGGPFGLSSKIKKSADICLSMSAFTFTHEFARLILLEQIFRATAIWSGSGYHK